MDAPRVCPLTWPSTYCWADDPQWVDCGGSEYEPQTPDTRVDIGVDLWGMRYPFKTYKPPIIDAAHNFADPQHGLGMGHGEIEAVVYSFAPQKEISCWEGGAVVFRDSEHADSARHFLHAGVRVGRTFAGDVGTKGLMSDVAASFILEQLKQHPKRKQRRQDVLEEYEKHLGSALLTKPGAASGHLAVVDAGSRAVRRLWAASLDKAPNIQWGHHYPLNEEQREACPNAAALSDRILTLPCHEQMTKWDVRRVVARIVAA